MKIIATMTILYKILLCTFVVYVLWAWAGVHSLVTVAMIFIFSFHKNYYILLFTIGWKIRICKGHRPLPLQLALDSARFEFTLKMRLNRI